MAAGRQNKRSNVNNVVGSDLQGQCRTKKKKRDLDSERTVFNLRPYIHLNWNAPKTEARPKREQIGITFGQMSSFLDSLPVSHEELADVFCIPGEMFDLDNLAGLLSYEVWETLLSDSDRKVLIEFLPRGINVEQVLKPLLTGEDMHFGNPLIDWGGLLCTGDLHPDAISNRNECIKASKKTHHSELGRYHDSIIERLQKLKQLWMSAKNPDNDFREMLCRRKNGMLKDGNLIVLRPQDGEKNCKEVVRSENGRSSSAAKIPLSKVKKRLTGKLSKFVGRVPSGNFMQPESFQFGKQSSSFQHDEWLEEKATKLRDHWLKLVNNDIALAFQRYRERKTWRCEWRLSVAEELRQESYADEDGNQTISDLTPVEVVDQDDKRRESNGTLGPTVGDKNESICLFNSNSDQLKKIPSLNSHCELSTSLQSEEGIDDIVTEEAATFNCSTYREIVLEPQVNIQSDVCGVPEAVWSSVSMSKSYFNLPTVSHGHSSGSEFLVDGAKSDIEPSHSLMSIESGMLNQEGEGASVDEICGSVLNMESGNSLHYSYLNRDHNGLVPSSLRGHGGTPQSYIAHQIDSQTQPSMQFPRSCDFSTIGQFPCHYEGQQHERVERLHNRESELYAHQLQCTGFPGGQQAGKDFFSHVDQLQSWAPDSFGLNHAQAHTNGSYMHAQNYYKPVTLFRNWHAADAPAPIQFMGGGVPVVGNLFGVMSQCTQMDPRHSFGPSVSEPYAAGRNGEIYPTSQSVHQNNSLVRHDAPPLKLNTSLMNFTYQDANLPDSFGRSFLNNWNQ